MAQITGTHWCNPAQLKTVRAHFDNDLFACVDIGVYSCSSHVGVVAIDNKGHLYGTTYIDINGIVQAPYEHLK